MQSESELLSQARLVTPLAARQYATATGWQPVTERLRSRVYLFRHRTERLRQLVIPMDSAYQDYAIAVLDVAHRLAEIEKRPISSVLTDLILPGADILRFRLISARAGSGSISLEAAINLLDGAKTALLSAAHTVEHPLTHHPRLNRLEGKELLQASRFGQTEDGSFVIKIICPLDAVDVPPAPDLIEPNAGQLPFVRRTTNLLMRSVDRLVTAVEQNTVVNAIAPPNEPPLSSNLCDALLTMLSADEQGTVSISATWAPILPQPAQTPVPGRVELQQDYFPVIEDVRHRLYPAREHEEAFYVGTVEELRGELDADGHRSGEVVLSLLHEGEKIPARVSLDAQQYTIADQVHMRPGGFVKLRGILQRGKRLSRIVSLADFQQIQ